MQGVSQGGTELTPKHPFLQRASGLNYIADGFTCCEKAKPSRFNYLSESDDLSCPVPYAVKIRDDYQSLTFDVKCGPLPKATQPWMKREACISVSMVSVPRVADAAPEFLELQEGRSSSRPCPMSRRISPTC